MTFETGWHGCKECDTIFKKEKTLDDCITDGWSDSECPECGSFRVKPCAKTKEEVRNEMER